MFITSSHHDIFLAQYIMLFLHNLSHLYSHFSQTTFKTVIHFCVTFHLDDYNSPFVGLSTSTLRPPLLVQNYATRFLNICSKFNPINPIIPIGFLLNPASISFQNFKIFSYLHLVLYYHISTTITPLLIYFLSPSCSSLPLISHGR